MDEQAAFKAVASLTVDVLTRPSETWPQWIREMPTEEFKTVLTLLLTKAALTEEQETRLLDLLGTTAGEMTQEELATWAPAILLSRNRTLAVRGKLPSGQG